MPREWYLCVEDILETIAGIAENTDVHKKVGDT